jgi:hypothetical protein
MFLFLFFGGFGIFGGIERARVDDDGRDGGGTRRVLHRCARSFTVITFGIVNHRKDGKAGQ